MGAALHPLRAEQGATFVFAFTWKTGAPLAAVDLTGFSARMEIRRWLGAAEALVVLTPENGRIQLGGVAGSVQALLTAQEMAALPSGEFAYALDLSFEGVVVRLLKGPFSVCPSATRLAA